MTWARIDDQLYLNEKIDRAGEEAAWLYVCAICYANHKLTDGRVPRERIPKLAYPLKALKLAERLVEVGLFERDGDDFIIHDFLDWNDPAEVVLKRREQTKQRVTKLRRNGRSNAVGNAVTPSVTDPPSNAGCTPSPSSSAFDVSSSSSSSTCVAPAWVDDDDLSQACWVLAQRKLASERAANRGPTTNPDGWLKTTFLGFKHDFASAPMPNEPGTPEQLADWLQPPVKPKPDPLDAMARAQEARFKRNDADKCEACNNTGWEFVTDNETAPCSACDLGRQTV